MNLHQMKIYREEKGLITYDEYGCVTSIKCLHCGEEMYPCITTKRYCCEDCREVFLYNYNNNTDLKTKKDVLNHRAGRIDHQIESLLEEKRNIVLENKNNCVYRFKNIYGEIIYIGKAKNLYNRLMSHDHLPEKCYKERTRIEYIEFDTEDDSVFAEKYFISKIKPKYNTIDKKKNITLSLKELDDREWKIL